MTQITRIVTGERCEPYNHAADLYEVERLEDGRFQVIHKQLPFTRRLPISIHPATLNGMMAASLNAGYLNRTLCGVCGWYWGGEIAPWDSEVTKHYYN